MHLWAHLQGGEAMGRCPFRATRPGGCRSGDHIHEAVTASPRTRPKRSPQGHGLLPNQQRTDALRPVSEPRSLRRLGSGRSRLQDDHRATTEAVGNALDSQPRQRNYCPSLFPAQWPLGRILGTTRRWLISGRFFTYKFGAHPREQKEIPAPPFQRKQSLGVGEGEVGAEADHPESAGGALTATEADAILQLALEGSGHPHDHEVGGGIEADGDRAEQGELKEGVSM